jgi:hypothetical protein
MASKPQSPGPATTSQPKQARSRKAATPSEQSAAGRAGSAGGIVLEKEQAAKTKKASVASSKAPAAMATPAKDQNATQEATGPNRPRRKPRKLTREPAAAQTMPAASVPTEKATAKADTATPQPTAAELEALKSRVRGLEAKVEELYLVAESRGARSPRRRGKGRKPSSTQVPTISTPAPTDDNDEEEADEELVRLEDELEVARRDLESFRPRTRPRNKRTTSGDTEYVEEIPRDDIGGTESATAVDRQVTLSGSYRIPLPASVSMNDVKTIQSGVSAAQNVAKSFLDQRRAARASSPATTSAAPSRPKATTKKSTGGTMEVSKDEGKSWGEWFGGYSVAISRAVKNIEAEAALEGQKVGAASGSARKAGGSASAAATKRPKARTGNLSSEQVQGLMR